MNEMTARRNVVESRLEAAINRGMASTIECGELLGTIRDERLWADDFESFELYCRSVWDISADAAKRWITAYRVSRNLGGSSVDFCHAIEDMTIAAARALERHAEPDAQAAVWSEAKEVSVSPSAEIIEIVAGRHKPLYRNVGDMTADEESEFFATAETDIEAAASATRSREWTKSAIRKLNSLLKTFDDRYCEADPRVVVAVSKIREAISDLTG